MTLLYDRRIRVEVAGLVVEDLRLAVDVSKSIDESQQRGRCVFYNLSPAHEELIYKRADSIVLHAGYPETIAQIFKGFVARVQRVRQHLSRQTIVTFGDSMRKGGETSQVLSGWTSQTLSGSSFLRDIVRLIVRDIGLDVGPLHVIPADATWKNWVFSGKASAALSIVGRRVGATWFEDDGVIRFNRDVLTGGAVQADAPTVRLSPTTGLINRARVTDEGAECVSLLNPACVLGGRLELESETLKGVWKIVGLRHTADNWTAGKFQTFLDLRPL